MQMAAALETASERRLWDLLATGPLKHVQFEGGTAIEGTGAEDRCIHLYLQALRLRS